MKRTVSAGLGGRNFIMDEDAFARLDTYLAAYGNTLDTNKKEALEKIEVRLGELLAERLGGRQVVDIDLVDCVALQAGLPHLDSNAGAFFGGGFSASAERPAHKFYRDTDDRQIGGVCSGLALFCDVDVVIIRIFAVMLLFFASAGFWIYIIICCIAPSARTPEQKCELRGIPCTEENLRRFSDSKK